MVPCPEVQLSYNITSSRNVGDNISDIEDFKLYICGIIDGVLVISDVKLSLTWKGKSIDVSLSPVRR